ncbi:MAG: hypothetical protein WC141_08585 [Arcobacteraceae bacterium]
MFTKKEWTQSELYAHTNELKQKNIEVVLVDTILKPLENAKTLIYNPFELQKFPKETVFVFYCDTGKNTKERLEYYQNKFPNNPCISLHGGRGYWRPNFKNEPPR